MSKIKVKKARVEAYTEDEPVHLVAILRDKTVIAVGDNVETDFHKKCLGVIFTVATISKYEHCESGYLISVHVKGQPERKRKSTDDLGIDANWFKKVV